MQSTVHITMARDRYHCYTHFIDEEIGTEKVMSLAHRSIASKLQDWDSHSSI